MSENKLSKETKLREAPPLILIRTCKVFVTGNANKLKEVRAILSDGLNGLKPIEIDSRDVESTLVSNISSL